MKQQTIFEMCMKVIKDSGVSMAFSRAYLYTGTLRLERTDTGSFVIKTLTGSVLGTLVDSNRINRVYAAYVQKKDELTLRADGDDYLRRN